MVKVIAVLLDKQEKKIFNEGLKIKPLKNISKVMRFRFYKLNKKEKNQRNKGR